MNNIILIIKNEDSNPQFPADLVTFTEEILHGKLHLLSNAPTDAH